MKLLKLQFPNLPNLLILLLLIFAIFLPAQTCAYTMKPGQATIEYNSCFGKPILAPDQESFIVLLPMIVILAFTSTYRRFPTPPFYNFIISSKLLKPPRPPSSFMTEVI